MARPSSKARFLSSIISLWPQSTIHPQPSSVGDGTTTNGYLWSTKTTNHQRETANNGAPTIQRPSTKYTGWPPKEFNHQPSSTIGSSSDAQPYWQRRWSGESCWSPISNYFKIIQCTDTKLIPLYTYFANVAILSEAGLVQRPSVIRRSSTGGAGRQVVWMIFWLWDKNMKKIALRLSHQSWAWLFEPSCTLNGCV